ncbi:probable 2-oxoglutarate-dependent dioxygenase AOP1 [Ricinus communis]|uniref:probable 2-oxoglutarate-dependent dioxygenase AOP1 n=1 Tax=Ricinus communis TaxID=3988 RepID=UPI00201A7CE0|nr:probable 2-oxoglutarate-dependent dioxygenase AOP1 [Ricinus communis]
MGSRIPPKIPVIDFSQENLKPGTSSWVSTCKNVLRALEEYGCFIAVYEKIPLELQSSFYNKLITLFDLPIDTKRKNVSAIPYYGYVGNQPFVPPLYEGMGINNAATMEGTLDFTNTMWPNGDDDFCKTVFSYSKWVAELEQMVTRMVFEGYGVQYSYDTQQERTNYLFRMMKYRAPTESESDLGCDVHTDKGFITVLHQNEVSGLEVQTKDGQWVCFEPSSPSSFIVMAADALLAWSNGRIHAAFHRVVMRGSKARYSVGLFSYLKGITEVPEELIDEEHPLQFKPFDNFGLLHYFYTEEGREKESTVKAYCGLEEIITAK